MAFFAVAATMACRKPVAARELTDNRAPAGYPAGAIAAAAPENSPLTEARARLGRRLFYEKRLSRTATIACASCHHQARAFADSAPLSVGVDMRKGTRNAPALVNRAWGSSFFWDGRASSLEELARQPIENPIEMDLRIADAVAVVRDDPSYSREFAAARETE